MSPMTIWDYPRVATVPLIQEQRRPLSNYQTWKEQNNVVN